MKIADLFLLSYDYLQWYNVDGYTRIRQNVIEARPGCPPLTSPLPCRRPCQNDRTCSRGMLCCKVACGNSCHRDRRDPFSKNQGRCPPPPATRLNTSCSDNCRHDLDCPYRHKCCQTACGVACVFPCFITRVGSEWIVPERCRYD